MTTRIIFALAAALAAPASATVSGQSLSLSANSTALHLLSLERAVVTEESLSNIVTGNVLSQAAYTDHIFANPARNGADAYMALSGQLTGPMAATFTASSGAEAWGSNGIQAYNGYQASFLFTLSAAANLSIAYDVASARTPDWPDLTRAIVTDETVANTQGWTLPATGAGTLTRTLGAGAWRVTFADVGTDSVTSNGFHGNRPSGAITHRFSVSLTPVITPPAVPEPTAWALLITGFALTGRALRRRAAAA